jgi:hypothetical protein
LGRSKLVVSEYLKAADKVDFSKQAQPLSSNLCGDQSPIGWLSPFICPTVVYLRTPKVHAVLNVYAAPLGCKTSSIST